VTERGSVTIWMLGFTLLVLFLGGIGIDMFRGFTQRQELAGMADSAAIAAATAVDVAYFRGTGEVRLDPDLAEDRAWTLLLSADGFDDSVSATVVASLNEVRVNLQTEVDLTLLRLLYGGEPLVVHVQAHSLPVEVSR